MRGTPRGRTLASLAVDCHMVGRHAVPPPASAEESCIPWAFKAGAVMESPRRFGIFLAPFHPVGQNPTLAFQRDLELIQRLDELGYQEAWVGEHHSAGYE